MRRRFACCIPNRRWAAIQLATTKVDRQDPRGASSCIGQRLNLRRNLEAARAEARHRSDRSLRPLTPGRAFEEVEVVVDQVKTRPQGPRFHLRDLLAGSQGIPWLGTLV